MIAFHGAPPPLLGGTEDVRMPADHFLADSPRHVLEGEGARLLGHARVKHHLQQEVAQLVAQGVEVVLRDRLDNLVRLFDGIGSDAGEGLFPIPGTARVRMAQRRHDLKQFLGFTHKRLI